MIAEIIISVIGILPQCSSTLILHFPEHKVSIEEYYHCGNTKEEMIQVEILQHQKQRFDSDFWINEFKTKPDQACDRDIFIYNFNKKNYFYYEKKSRYLRFN